MDTTPVETVLLDRTLDIVVLLDESGRFRYANSAVERVLGYAPDDVLGRDALSLVHPDDRPRVSSVFTRLVDAAPRDADARALSPTEFRYRAADGSWVWLAAQMSTEPALGSDEYVVTCRDVSPRREAEAEQRRTHQRFLTITEHTNDVLWMFSGDYSEVLFINSAYETVWGRSVDDLRADPTDFINGVHPADRDRVHETMARLSDGESVDLEYRVDATNSYRTWVWVQGYPLVDDDGSVSAVVGFARDVTDRRERERQLLVMDRLLRHNLRNEMNLILGHAEQARSNGGEAVEADVARIVRAGEHLLRTVDKERDVVGLLTNDPDPVVVDLVAVTTDICGRVRERYPEATIEVSLPETVDVRAVPKLSLAIYELLTNAVEHADVDDPTVTLTVRVDHEDDGDGESVVGSDDGVADSDDDGAGGTSDARTVTLSVADECPPIPIQEIRVLRGERDVRSVYHGSGLGLWLVYWAVDRSGGDLAFGSGTRGNTVSVTLDAA
ncbi:histidine kinase [Salinigranum rubrum]|uniref:histidine kinase n=1 Tax=Salinigranum rubrum TaxID=755307 RepID=A0A2I8VG95_9EURY|nr:PAS domain S-box protein [Salinigranum rubrum]AUV80957.1 histidine kinase [Salinigranum rubrum]